MSVKLIKICKEFNIAASTLIQWCEQNGIEVAVEKFPRTLFSDELYEKIKRHFENNPDIEVRVGDVKTISGVNYYNDDGCSPGDNDLIDDAFEGDAELYNDWLLN